MNPFHSESVDNEVSALHPIPLSFDGQMLVDQWLNLPEPIMQEDVSNSLHTDLCNEITNTVLMELTKKRKEPPAEERSCDMESDLSQCAVSNHDLPNYVNPPLIVKMPMQSFPVEKVTDFKHVIYNLLVEYHNSGNPFVQPCYVVDSGVMRTGFRFNEKEEPEQKLPELYALHIKKARLEKRSKNLRIC